MKAYYSDQYCTIYHGDCREILPQLPRVDVIICDPPYGVNLGNHGGAKETRPGFLVKSGYASYDDTPENYTSIVVPVISECVKCATRSAVFGVAPNIFQLPPAKAIGGVYLPAGCGRSPWGFQNLALVLFYGCAPNLNLGAKHTTIRSSQSADKNGHPCPKPLEWMTWLVGLCSVESDTILDPFMGSGTTLRAAKDLGRKSIGIEICEEYCEIAAKRCCQDILNFHAVKGE